MKQKLRVLHAPAGWVTGGALCLLAAVMPMTAQADNHALIMGVVNYATQPLHGVKRDRESAREIARSLGVPDSQIVERKDKELTLDGLKKTLREFASRIKPGDHAFVYFSGHGTSWTSRANACDQGLVAQDGKFLPKDEFHALLQPAQQRAARMVLFLDTCFSGGVVDTGKSTTRAFGDDQPQPKFFEAKLSSGDADPCSVASNYAKATSRDFADIEKAAATPNYYLLGAAGPDEYAIDGGVRQGGLATTAFLACLQPGAGADTNNDGVITLAEARLCAQTRVNGMVRPPFLRQTLTEGSGAGAGATPAAFSAPPNATGDAAQLRIDGKQLFETIRQGADQGYRVQVKSAKPAYRIKKDYLELEVTSNRSGYLTLLSVGSSGRIFQLFPNELDRQNRIEADVPLKLPRPEWRVSAGGPPGQNRFLAVISSTPDRLKNIGLPVAGRFRVLDGNAAAARALAERLRQPAADCVSATSSRDFDQPEANACASSYGAGTVDVEEVN